MLAVKILPKDAKIRGTITIHRELSVSNEEKIPTTFLSLTPEKLIVEGSVDVLVGLFHIMWEDMPRRRTYELRLEDLVSFEGIYLGPNLKCANTRLDLT